MIKVKGAIGLMSMVLFLGAIFVSPGQVFAQTAEEWVELGKEKLFEYNNNPWEALACFNSALDEDGDYQPALFWRAVTVSCSNSDLVTLLRDLNIINASNDWLIYDAEGNIYYTPEADVENIIIDDLDPHYYSETGTWGDLPEVEDEFNTYGSQCRYHDAGSGNNQAVWTLNIATPGYYQVDVWVPSSALNTPDAKYTINYSGGSTMHIVNQAANTGWHHLGQYPFDTTGTYTIVLSDNASPGRVIADAVELDFVGIIIDDGDATGFTKAGVDAGWQTVSGAGYKSNYHWHAAGTGATATWTPDIPETGQYQVYVRWIKLGEGSSEAEYTITPAGETVTVDQLDDNHNERWVCLGVYNFSAGTGNTIQLKSSSSGKVVADAIKVIPCRPFPNLTGVQSQLESLIAEIDLAIADLGCITNTFSDDVNLSDDPLNPYVVYLDYGDAKSFQAGLYLLKTMINIFAAYDMDGADIQKIGFRFSLNIDFTWMLSEYANLLEPLGDAGTKLAAAKTALESAISVYRSEPNGASYYIRNDAHRDDYTHLVSFYEPYELGEDHDEWLEDKNEALANEAEVRDFLTAIYNNLTNHTTYPYVVLPFPEDEDGDIIGPGIDMAIDFYEFFTNPKDIRAFINALKAEIDDHDFIYDSFSNPTFDGVFPYTTPPNTTTPADWNYLLGNGPDFEDDPLVIWDGNTASVELEWEEVSEQSAKFDRYEIYRKTLTSAWELVDTITNHSTTTFPDDTIDGLSNIYYYRIHTYYDFGGGNTAHTYSETGKAVLRVYVDAAYTGTIIDGSKDHPYTKIGDGIRRADRGTKVCVAADTYNEAAMDLRMWNKSDLILEGGYESTHWSRDIEANETIIDAAGKGDWSCVGISNVSGVTIDGFTITNAVGQDYASGIDVYHASSTIIKNCKITNCNRGISIGEGVSSCLVENCNIQGRKAQSAGHGGISIWSANSVEIRNCTITDSNETSIGVWDNSSVNIENCIINNNNWGISVGNGSSASFFNNLIETNDDSGIDVWNSNTTASIINNTIVKNKGAGGIRYSDIQSIEIKNNIIADNNGGWGKYGIYGGLSVSADIINNNVHGHAKDDYHNCGTDAGSVGNISTDALFAQGPYGHYYLGQIASGQGQNSPCVDTGSDLVEDFFDDSYTTRTDYQGDTGTVDMGYHYPVVGKSLNAVVINEFLPNPVDDDTGSEWVELYNRNDSPINIGGCWIDDEIGEGGNPQMIPYDTIIDGYDFYVYEDLPGNDYFDNDSDTVNFLAPDGETVIDSKTYTGAVEGIVYYRYPDGKDWRLSNTPTKGTSNNTIPPMDSDGDGLPDAWEMEHFKNLDQGADDDPDSDGYSNLAEYQAQTDPQDDSSIPASLSGAVFDHSGTAIGGITVWHESDLYDVDTDTVSSGVDGSYAFSHLLLGLAEVCAEPDPATRYAISPTDIYLKNGDSLADFDFYLRQGALVEGQLTVFGDSIHPDGVDVDACRGSFDWGWAESENGGNYKMCLVPGNYTIGIYESDEYIAWPQDITVSSSDDDQTLNITIHPIQECPTVNGNITINASSHEDSNFVVLAFPAGGDMAPGPISIYGHEGSLGQYTLPVIPNHTYDILFGLFNKNDENFESFTVISKAENVAVADVDVTGINFSFNNVGGEITGTVTADGVGVLMALVAVLDSSRNFVGSADSDQNGEYHIHNVPIGDYTAYADHRDYRISAGIPAAGVTYDGSITVDIPISDEIIVSVADECGAPEETDIPVPITVNDAAGIVGIQIILSFDPDILEAVDVRTTALTDDFDVSENLNYGLGQIKFLVKDDTLSGILSGSGAIVEVLFNVNSGASIGEYCDLILQEVKLGDAEGDKIPSTAVKGTFTVAQEKGDINNDGEIDIYDVIKCLRFVLEFNEPTPAQRYATDMNNDSEIDIYDVIKILRKILELP